MSINLESFIKNGFLHLQNFIDREFVSKILYDAKSIFLQQFRALNYTNAQDINDLNNEEFNEFLFRLFEENIIVFTNCGKQVQHLISLHKLSLNDKLINLVIDLGLKSPAISTRPVLFFNHPKLAKEKIYYKVDAHQDWRSMQGSLNSVVIWIPLMNIDKSLGALEILPKSHKLGLVTDHIDQGFGMVDLETLRLDSSMIPVEVNEGDILVFSSFLIHQSGENIANEPRWSCHFRYNDLSEKTFISRGYPHAYIYKPVDHLLTHDFPKSDDLNELF
jgi:ectoine hydroxylase-related dioxygenase (phytanoyl-CoA dioxygenase family)